MKKKYQKSICIAGSLLLSFVIWTLLVRFIDVKAIGPAGSSVGFSAMNGRMRDLIGVNMTLYTISDWLGLVPIATAFGFAVFGLAQWIKRKHLCRVDHDILYLGVFYIAVIAVYVFFEMLVINYRPFLIDGYLEASYPSSTTMLVLCVMPTAAMQLNTRIKSHALKRCVCALITLFTGFMVIGRILSGVHWITDIIGGMLCSTGLVMAYRGVCQFSKGML
jgi:undecaprenyl-diphosphatase